MPRKKLTERELLDIQAMSVVYLDLPSCDLISDITELGELLPCIVHLNNKESVNVEYINERGAERLESSVEELLKLGPKFFDTHIHPHIKPFLPKIAEFYQQNDESNYMTFFQKMRGASSEDYEWLFTTTKVSKRHDALFSVSVPIRQIDQVGEKMNRLLDEHAFMKRNFHKFMSLTRREKEILTLVAQGYSSSQISEILHISRHTVERHRKNLIAKLEAQNISTLIKYAEAFDLIKT